MAKAQDLNRGDVFCMNLYCEVLSVKPVGDGKLVKVKAAIENQGRRIKQGVVTGSNKSSPLEFTDDGHTLEFICKWSRNFRRYIDRDWDDDRDDDEVGPDPVRGPELETV